MSRLFSHLENIGHDRTETETPAPARVADAAAALRPGMPVEAKSPDTLPASAPREQPGPVSTVKPLMPGYAIASQLSLSSAQPLPAAPARATWPVRLWFISLLALIGVSLAMLLSPRPAPPAGTVAAPMPPSLPITAAVEEAKPAMPSAAAAGSPSEQRQPSLPARATAPAADPACSPAMAAMNLCSATHP